MVIGFSKRMRFRVHLKQSKEATDLPGELGATRRSPVAPHPSAGEYVLFQLSLGGPVAELDG